MQLPHPTQKPGDDVSLWTNDSSVFTKLNHFHHSVTMTFLLMLACKKHQGNVSFFKHLDKGLKLLHSNWSFTTILNKKYTCNFVFVLVQVMNLYMASTYPYQYFISMFSGGPQQFHSVMIMNDWLHDRTTCLGFITFRKQRVKSMHVCTSFCTPFLTINSTDASTLFNLPSPPNYSFLS